MLSRAATQLNIFAVGFPVTIAVGFVALLVMLPHLTVPLEHLFGEGLRTMLQIAPR